MAIGRTNAGGGAAIKQIVTIETNPGYYGPDIIDVTSYGFNISNCIILCSGRVEGEVVTRSAADAQINVAMLMSYYAYLETSEGVTNLNVYPSALRNMCDDNGFSNGFSSAIDPSFNKVTVTIIEYWSGIKLNQSGVSSQSGASSVIDVTLTAVNPDKCLIIIQGNFYAYSKRSSYDSTYAWHYYEATGEMTSTTNLRIEILNTPSSMTLLSTAFCGGSVALHGGYVGYQVIEFY